MNDTQLELIGGQLINMAYVECIGLLAESSGNEHTLSIKIQFQSGKSIDIRESLLVDPKDDRTRGEQINALIEGLCNKYGKPKDS